MRAVGVSPSGRTRSFAAMRWPVSAPQASGAMACARALSHAVPPAPRAYYRRSVARSRATAPRSRRARRRRSPHRGTSRATRSARRDRASSRYFRWRGGCGRAGSVRAAAPARSSARRCRPPGRTGHCANTRRKPSPKRIADPPPAQAESLWGRVVKVNLKRCIWVHPCGEPCSARDR